MENSKTREPLVHPGNRFFRGVGRLRESPRSSSFKIGGRWLVGREGWSSTSARDPKRRHANAARGQQR